MSAISVYKEILKEHWGYDNFRGIQADIILSITSGKDTLGLMPTGGGKSITFQVPALSMEGTCIVITNERPSEPFALKRHQCLRHLHRYEQARNPFSTR